jgi:ribosomal protein L11 methyltransferase
MKWNKFRLKTTTEAEDIVSSMLADLGVEGVQIEDKVPLTAADKEQMFVDIVPETEADDGIAYLSFYLDVDEDAKGLLVQIREELADMSAYLDVGACTIEESQTEDVDWVNNWKQYFHQFCVDDVLIIPSWEDVDPQDEGKMVIHIDPGTAFGTGMHETTQLCIRQLRKYVTETTRLLDVGCGSGILGMLALKFGAAYAVGTDLDPCAITATHENMGRNGISTDQYEVMIGNVIDDVEVQDKVRRAIVEAAGAARPASRDGSSEGQAAASGYDIVVANILAEVLVELTPVVAKQLKPGGIYITSGIIDDKERTVVECVKKAGLDVLEVTYQGEWVSVTAKKP